MQSDLLNLLLIFIFYIHTNISAPLAECSCSDKSFDISLSFIKARKNEKTGNDIQCYHYTIERIIDFDPNNRCTRKINYILLGVSTYDCLYNISHLNNIIVDYGASDDYNCNVNLIKDFNYDVLGLKYECDFQSNNAVNIYFCTTIYNENSDNTYISYISNNHYGVTCPQYNIPDFCNADNDNDNNDDVDHRAGVYKTPTPICPYCPNNEDGTYVDPYANDNDNDEIIEDKISANVVESEALVKSKDLHQHKYVYKLDYSSFSYIIVIIIIIFNGILCSCFSLHNRNKNKKELHFDLKMVSTTADNNDYDDYTENESDYNDNDNV